MKFLLSSLVLMWLAIGLMAALSREYFSDEVYVDCVTAGDIALTVAAGPLNHVGVNPSIVCPPGQPTR